MTAGLAQYVSTGPEPWDNSSAVRISPGELVLLTESLSRSPSDAVSFTVEFEGSDVYATMSASSARTVAIGSVEYIALSCHLTDIVTAPGLSAGFALSERCSLFVPTPLRQGDGIGYLLPGRYPN
ncbi:hypothetical protein [Mycolicibacterium goodii]|jgi:hypothetical protein|uniref:hypothetical protein n=1 Tax=Mycolicibacterium goodii TaxID=134601 RepID=UPI001BDC2E0A|nr:hypothetical protein [Mycolicibacterium goodii]MBU8840251.1 hypothetical protein [Mycolicibacterium goodii]